MDFFVKYFNKDRVVCRYLTSRFLGHTCAEDLKKESEEGIQEFDMKKMVHISMDGPNFNLSVLYDSIVEDRNQNDDYPALIDIVSCSLHVVHGAFRHVVQKKKMGYLMVFSKPCTTCLKSSLQKEKVTKILLD